MDNSFDSNKQGLIHKLWNKFVNRETISYVVVGVLTTVVNLVTFDLLCNKLHINDLVGNVIAWFIAVAFAYVTNNLIVFRSGIANPKKELEKVIKFFGARVVTLGIEEAGLLVFVTILHFNNMIVKLGLAVIVIIVNYVFSKLFIFNKK